MKKLFAILLAFIFLATNLPFAITTHFCSGEAVESAFVLKGNTVDCGMNETNTVNRFSQFNTTKKFQNNLETAPCCQNHSQVFEITDDYSSALELSLPTDYSFFQVFFVANFVKTFFNWLFSDFNFSSSYLIPAPPLLKQDILILFQCFLI
jgi:hypothetical protein